MKRVYALLSVAALGIICAACTRVQSTVVRTDLLPPVTASKSYYFLPSKAQQISAEYVGFTRAIGRRLAAQGLIEARDFKSADYAVIIDYGISGTQTVTGESPIYGQTGGGTTYHSGTVNSYGGGFGSYSGTSYTPPTYGVIGSVPYSRTEHTRYLTFKLVDIKASTNEKLVPVYEARVISTGEAPSFAQVSDCMFESLFKNFRKSGSETVTLNAKECAPSAPQDATQAAAAAQVTG